MIFVTPGSRSLTRVKSSSSSSGSGFSNVQIFTSSGNWTKPASGTLVFVRMWAGGGSGGCATTGCGGGGGGYVEFIQKLSAFAASETVTIGQGGTGKTGSVQVGQNGGTTSITINGVTASVFGGAGGGSGTAAGSNTFGSTGGGGGGGLYAAPRGVGLAGPSPFGDPTVPFASGGTTITPLEFQQIGQGGIGGYLQSGCPCNTPIAGSPGGLWSGGGGGYPGDSTLNKGGNAYYGGAGGGGKSSNAVALSAGISIFGGNGGKGANSSTAPTSGVFPAGGGGGTITTAQTSGAGANGAIYVYVI